MIERKKEQRLKFLEKLYQVVDGSESSMVNMWELGEELDFDRPTTSNVVAFLRGEGLIESKALGGGISITHFGVVEIEQARENPTESTEYFPPVNIINIEKMDNSSIQQGNISSTQNSHFESDKLTELKSIISELQNVISQLEEGDLKRELIAEKGTLKAQSESPKPKKNIITETLNSIKKIGSEITIKTLTGELTELINSFIGI